MNKIEGGVTAAKGFQAASTAANIKYKDRTDMALLYSTIPCRAAGTFTTNLVKAAPVKWDQAVVYEQKRAQAVVVNSGIANACTGKDGMEICRQTAEETGRLLSVPSDGVLIASTGVIGMQIPIERIKEGVSAMAGALSDSLDAGHAAAKAIMTTDTRPKEAEVEFTIGGKTVTLGGMSKGSGMIHPNMCTMLCFITTDACISQELLQKALREDVKKSFNMISVDGDTSTNDTVILLANGMAGNPEITAENEDYQTFCEALSQVTTALARMMAGDGEGATALFEVRVKGASTWEQAAVLARSVVSSSLTKAAIYGHDANCGRVLCAMGYAGVPFDPEKTDLWFESRSGRIKVIENGTLTDYDEGTATKILSEDEVTAIADIKEGDCEATAWGCDLTYDYVKINADYRS